MNENRIIVDDEYVDDVQIDKPVIDVQDEETAREGVAREGVTRENVAREAVKEGPTSWLTDEEIEDLKSRWKSVQVEFVDDPHASIKQADDLVAEAVELFQKALHRQRTELVDKWSHTEDVSTEDLRVGLQNYRSFLDRLLKMKTTSL